MALDISLAPIWKNKKRANAMNGKELRRICLLAIVLLSINLSLILIINHTLRQILHMSFIWMTIIMVIILTGMQVWLYWVIVKQRLVAVETISKKIKDVEKHVDNGHILLERTDPYYDLAMALNELQDFARDQNYWLARREGELATLVANLPVGVLVINAHRQIKVTNLAVSRLLGQKVVVGHQVYQDINNHFGLTSLIEKALHSKEKQQATLEFDNGEMKKTAEVTIVINEPTKAHFQMMIILYDITEIVQLEQMQVDFVSNVSHELKTPITAISGFVETLQAGAKEDPKALTDFLQIISDESQRLTDLVEDVLSLSRITSANVTEKQVKINLASWLDQQLLVLSGLANIKNITLINNVNTPFYVMLNEQKMAQIIKNIVGNAIKYGHLNGHVVIEGQLNDNNWQLQIIDDGIGIPEKQQQRVFERFYRGDSSRTQRIASGTGLGLAIVKELVAKQNGQISLKSQVGVGTTINLLFQYEKPELNK